MGEEYDFQPWGIQGVNANGDTLLHVAARHNDVELVKLLLQKGIDVTLKNKAGETASDIASSKLFTDITRLMSNRAGHFRQWIEEGTPDQRDSSCCTKLMKAVDVGEEGAVSSLLGKGVNVNGVSMNGLTALMIAAYRGHLGIAKMLVENGADVHARSLRHNNALDIAKKRGHSEIVALLAPLTSQILKPPSSPVTQTRNGDVQKEKVEEESNAQKKPLQLGTTIRMRNHLTIRRGQSLFEDTNGPSQVELSLEEHISSLDEFVKWGSTEDVDISNLIDLPKEPILGKTEPLYPPLSPRNEVQNTSQRNVQSQPQPQQQPPQPQSQHLQLPQQTQQPSQQQSQQTQQSSQPKQVNQSLSISIPQNDFPQNGPSNNVPQPQSSPQPLSYIQSQPHLQSPSRGHRVTSSPRVNDLGVPEMDREYLMIATQTIEQFEQDQKFKTTEQTSLDNGFQNVLGYTRQLITAVHNNFTGQFVDITAQVVHEIGEIAREVKETFKEYDQDKKTNNLPDNPGLQQKRDKISQLMKTQDQQLQILGLKTKMASGVWPPKNSELEMVEATVALSKTSKELLNICHSTNLFKAEEEDEENQIRRLDFKEYKRQRNLKLLEEISQVEKSSVLQEEEEEEIPEEPSAEDNAFLEDLEASIKTFVMALLKLKQAKEKEEKQEYVSLASKVCDEANMIAKKVDTKMGEITGLELESNVYNLKSLIHSHAMGIPPLCSEVLVKANLSTGVWPPPNAAAAMMDAALTVATSVKELVHSAKTAVLEYREIWKKQKKFQKQSQKDWEKKLLQNQKIEKFDVLVKQEHYDFIEGEQGEVKLTQEEDELLCDSEDENGIIFDEVEGTRDKPVVKGGTLEKLVERLTYFKYPDPEYRLAFLLTYQSFTTPDSLFLLLVKIYEKMPPLGLNEREFSIYLEKKIKPTRLRVFNVLKAWIDDHFEDWSENSELISLFRKFVEQRMVVDLKSAAQQLMKLLRDKLEGLKRQSILTYGENVEIPKPILPKSCKKSQDLVQFLKNEKDRNWGNVDAIEMARQMTLIEFSMYEKIQAKECIGQAWNGKKKHISAPNISAVIAFTNKISSWVATKILDSEDIRVRVATLKYFLLLAGRCMDINNFNSANAILAALESSPVHRLKKTWEVFQDKKYRPLAQIHENMNSLFSPKGNYANYRKHLHTINPPVVPFLGVYLTDLTFIEDGNSDYLPAPNKHMINFDKRKKISKSISEIKMYKQIPYYLMEVPEIQSFFLNVQGLDERMLYKRSLVVEPKEEQS